MAAATTETEIRYEQVTRVDGPGDYRLVEDPFDGLQLTTKNPFSEEELPSGLLVASEFLRTGFSYTIGCKGELFVEPYLEGLLRGGGVMNVVESPDGHTVIYYDTRFLGLTTGYEFEFHMIDVGTPIIKRSPSTGEYGVLYDSKQEHDGTLDLNVSYWHEESPWHGKIKRQGDNPSEAIDDSTGLVSVALGLSSTRFWKKVA